MAQKVAFPYRELSVQALAGGPSVAVSDGCRLNSKQGQALGSRFEVARECDQAMGGHAEDRVALRDEPVNLVQHYR